MGLLSSLDTIKQRMTEVERQAKKFNNIKPAEFREYIDTLSRELSIFCDGVETMTTDDRNYVRTRLIESKSMVYQHYNNYVSELSGNAMRDEKNSMFASMTYSAHALMETCAYISDNVEDLFNDKVINLYNTRISQVGILGVLRNANICASYFNYMLVEVTAATVKGLTSYPYRLEYIVKNQAATINNVNNIYGKSGSFSFLADIKEMKKRNLDMFVLDSDGKSNAADLPYDSLPIDVKSNFISGLFGLNFFRWLGETWASVRHHQFTKMQAEREWVSTHVNLLKMASAKMDPDSKEYQRNIAIIEKYNKMIAKLDKKLATYFTED